MVTTEQASDQLDPHQLRCMEIFGGNGVVHDAVSTPGFDVFLFGEPFEGGEGGGDVHYLSMCAAGRVTRFALADISGHGITVDESAKRLRKVVRKHINTANQAGLVRALNEEVLASEAGNRFATAVVATYYAPARALVLTIAGHPCPLWYRAAHQRWVLLGPATEGVELSGSIAGERNFPLGVIDGTEFSQMRVPLGRGDLVILYTDALIEAQLPDGQILGEEGLVEVASGVDVGDLPTLGDRLLTAVRERSGRVDMGDDVTVLTLHHSAAAPASQSVGDRIATLGRALGLGG
ncbi:MAG: PP2C family protein-serine/threonine phosphatase [Planctomycetota bacterium]